MPAGVEVRPIADLALTEARPSMAKANGAPLDAVVMLGHHASTPNPRAFCSHTFIWEMDVSLDGEPLSEVRVYAQALAAERVPVLLAAGDRWMLEELGEGELGGAGLVATKEGLGRGRVRSRGVAEVHAELTDAIAAALAEPPQPPPPRSYPASLRIAGAGAAAPPGQPGGDAGDALKGAQLAARRYAVSVSTCACRGSTRPSRTSR